MPARVVDLKILASSDQARAALDLIAAKADALAKLNPTIKVRVDAAAYTQGLAVLRAETAKATAAMLKSNQDAATKTVAVWTRAGGLLGRFSLFGGAATIGGIHLLIDAIAEVAAIVIPASIALAAFGAAASGTISDIVTHLKNVNTVSTATGQALAPLSGQFAAVQAAVKPEVYQLYGDALTIINNRTGAFGKLATGTGVVLDQLGTRFTDAVTHGTGLSVFMAHAIPDVAGLGNVLGNLGGTLGNLVKVMPGYAQVFLSVAGGITHVLEVASSALGPLLGFGLAMHGVFLYGGLLVTALLALQGPVKALALSIVTGPVRALQAYVLSIAAADGASATLAAAFAPLLANPFVWIGIAVVALGALAYWMANSKSATQQWISSLQATVLAAPTVSAGIKAIGNAQVQVVNQLTTANQNLQAVQVKVSGQMAQGGRAALVASEQINQARAPVEQLTAAQKGFNAEQVLSTQRLGSLSKTYGGTRIALGLLNAAGITEKQWQDKSAAGWLTIRTQVASTALAYTDMHQVGGVLGADMYILTKQASDQYTAMTSLNSAWTTFLGLVLSLEANSASAISAFRKLRTDAQVTGATMTGVNNVSLTLQNDFNTGLAPAVQQVITGMRDANAPTHKLAQVVATELNPAVHAGALENAGMKTAIYDMAREAGYAGPDQIGPLTVWFKRNATSVQNAANQVATYAQNLGKIPPSPHSAISVTGTGSWVVTGPGPSPGTHIRTAAGWLVSGGTPGVDSVPILAMPGETVVPRHLTPAIAPLMRAHGVPGFASGGVVGSYGPGTVPGLGAWVGTEYSATTKAIEQAVAAAAKAAIATAILGATGGGSFGGGVGQWTPQVLTALSMVNVPASYLHDVLYQMQTESGGNPTIVNRTDSNWLAGHPSVGLMQVIAGTFATYAGQFRNTGPFEYGVSVDPLANIYAALNYGTHNGRGFGTGPGQIGSGHGYAMGGVLPESIWGIGKSGQRYSLHAGETVIPARGAQKIVLEIGHGHGHGSLDQALLTWIRANVRTKGGGSVEVAFGSS